MTHIEKCSNDQNKNVVIRIVDWIDYRLPIFGAVKYFLLHLAPKNLNYMWNFGSIAFIGLLIQIITGVILAMHYTPHVEHAFDSVEKIMRNVNYGWLIRYLHAVGASMFFIATYAHIFRSLYYGSYKKPRELLWHIGLIIFLLMIVTAFLGYVLPWGQMSYWAATVITNLFTSIPLVGQSITTLLWGGFSVDNPTLNRFFALHYLIPFILFFFVLLHIGALLVHGSNNPDGVEPKKKDMIPFHPYYTIKDVFGFGLYFIIFAYFVFYKPNALGHPDNYIPADPLVTPAHIVPEWYFLPFYAILRAIPSKLGGFVLMLSSIIILFFLPWIDKSSIKSAKHRPLFKVMFWLFFCNCILLGYLGGQPAEQPYISLSQFATLYYFAHFLIIIPFISYREIKNSKNR